MTQIGSGRHRALQPAAGGEDVDKHVEELDKYLRELSKKGELTEAGQRRIAAPLSRLRELTAAG